MEFQKLNFVFNFQLAVICLLIICLYVLHELLNVTLKSFDIVSMV